jgi:hypothetical protein
LLRVFPVLAAIEEPNLAAVRLAAQTSEWSP